MRAFRDALAGLTARLEAQRYRVASASAKLASPPPAAAARAAEPHRAHASVDRSA
jgi:hypothetical protein